jgi:WD40 repeat protein
MSNLKQYKDFVIELNQSATGQTYSVCSHSSVGKASAEASFPNIEKIKNLEARLQAALCETSPGREELAQQIGHFLFEDLFIGDIQSRYRRRMRVDKRLRIRLIIRVPALANLPWEYLYDSRDRRYLSLSILTPVVRQFERTAPYKPLGVTPPLRILGLVASPQGLPAINVDKECKLIEDALADLVGKGLVLIHWVANPDYDGFREVMGNNNCGWHILHFIGHGGFNSEHKQGFICLVNKGGAIQEIYANDLANLLEAGGSLRMVFLNSCQGGATDSIDLLSSTAAHLMCRGIPAVVDMQYPISDNAASALAYYFYKSLTEGSPADKALTEARQGVKNLPSDLEWGVPVMHLCSSTGELFHWEGEPKAAVSPPQSLTVSERWGRRLGRGDIRQVIPVDDRQAIVISGGGATWLDTTTRNKVIHEVDAPSTRGALNRDNHTLALGIGQTIELWDLHKRECLRRIAAHRDWVRALAFSPDGKYLASGGNDHDVCIWNVADGERLYVLRGHQMWVNDVGFSSDGRLLASSGEDGVVQLWDPRQGEHIRALEKAPDSQGERLNGLDFAPLDFATMSYLLAVGSRAGVVYIWDTRTGKWLRTLRGHMLPVRSVSFSADGRMLASGGDDGTIHLWDPQTGVAWPALSGHSKIVRSVAFSPVKGSFSIFSGSDDGTIRCWDAPSQNLTGTLDLFTKGISCICFKPDGKTLISAGPGNLVQLWDVASGDTVGSQEHTDKPTSVACSPDGNLIASGGGNDNTVRLWDNTGKQLRVWDTNHIGGVNYVAFSPDGRYLVSAGNDDTVRLWSNEGSQDRAFEGHEAGVNGVAFSPNGCLLATAGGDDLVRLWNTHTAGLVHRLSNEIRGVGAVTFSPNGAFLVSGDNNGAIKLWDTSSGGLRRVFEQPHHGQITSLAINRTNDILASSGSDGQVHLYRVMDGILLRTLGGHTRSVRSVAFSPAGNIIASASDDGTIRLWKVD